MSVAIRYELVYATIHKSDLLVDTNIYNDIHKQFEFQRQFILADKSLSKNEKAVAIRSLTKNYDRNKVICNEGVKRICENCNQECLATLYCEFCIRNYLKAKFSNWASGNRDIDDLIQKCQMEALMPEMIIEWIPYNKLKNIKYLTKGGFSEIYTADWIGGCYDEWDSKRHQLKRVERFTSIHVILKSLENVENANRSWFEEAKSHLAISNKLAEVVRCFGLTQDPLNGNYMLVMAKRDMDLRKYLQENHHQLIWKERIRITFEIISALYFIHFENAIHRDLHSGNILYSQLNNNWRICDLGFCGPADKSSKSIYGNLPYIAPEVINGKEYTFKSDIYSIAMIMWEISSGQPPFINYAHDYNLAINIINGIRPKIISGIPLKYKSLMEQCWNADPLKRLDIQVLWKKMQEIHFYYQNMANKSNSRNKKSIKKNFKNSNLLELPKPEANKNLLVLNKTSNITTNHKSSRLFTSKSHEFDNMPEPRNATEEELEAFHSKPHDFSISDNIDIKRLSKEFEILKMNSTKGDVHKRETIQQPIMEHHVDIYDKADKNDMYNNPNLHSEEQDELGIPDDTSNFSES